MNKEIVLKKVLTWSRGLAIEGETKEDVNTRLVLLSKVVREMKPSYRQTK